MKNQSHQMQFLTHFKPITISCDGLLELEATWNTIGASFANAFGTYHSLLKIRDVKLQDKKTNFFIPYSKSNDLHSIFRLKQHMTN
eukprot:2495473-Ditylum_brightwellii.AAC.1